MDETQACRPPPPEWSEHRAVWLAWPAHAELWGAALQEVQACVREIAWALGGEEGGEAIEVLVRDATAERQAREAMGVLPHRLHRMAYGDIWLRDTAPIFAGDGTALAFTFNGWGEKYRLPGDGEVAAAVAKAARRTLRRSSLVLEGGAIEGDGEGTVITTRQCALNPNRNPARTEAEVERELSRLLGTRKVIWLEEGLDGDHTDGHVDNLARFVAPGRVLCGRPTPGDPNAAVLAQIVATLEGACDAAGRVLEVLTLPVPAPMQDDDGQRMPATHLNFFVGNRRVLLPTYGGESDAEASAKLGRCFPDREVLGIACNALLRGGGAIHCVTQQEPGER